MLQFKVNIGLVIYVTLSQSFCYTKAMLISIAPLASDKDKKEHTKNYHGNGTSLVYYTMCTHVGNGINLLICFVEGAINF